ncbi:MAG: hypothetical protein DME60_13750 [Verrucomicrobia bacterium]|nr:MAG: hypothetical protein DME60_13750 [Verrucomicrobiota bacterium]
MNWGTVHAYGSTWGSFFAGRELIVKKKRLIFVFLERNPDPPSPSLRRDESRGFEQSGERTACPPCAGAPACW